MTEREALEQLLEALDKELPHNMKHIAAGQRFNARTMLAQPEQKPVAWLQFKENEPPVVVPRDLGTPVFIGIRGGLAHDAGEKP